MIKPLASKARRDLVWAALFFLLFTGLAYTLDLNEFYIHWAAQHEEYELDELPAAFSAMFVVFGWFSWRRWREYRNELSMRQRTETDLREERERLRDLLDAGSDRFWETDDQHRIVWHHNSHRARPATDYANRTRWEVLGVDPKIDAHWAAHFADLEARSPFRNFRYSHTRSGRVGYRSLSGKPFYDAQGTFRGYRGITADITKEIEAQKEAAEARAQFFSAIETVADGYALWDRDDRLVTCNDKYQRSAQEFGVSLQPGVTFEDFIRGIAKSGGPSEALGREDQWVQEALANHRSGTSAIHVPFGDRWLEVTEHRVPNGTILTVTRDITVQKELEQQLHRAQKMKAVGQLTGGIAHDFNNLLQVILGNIEMIVEQAPPGGKIGAQAKVVQTAAERGADLIRRLMAFSRQQTLQPFAFDVNEMVNEIGEIVRRILGEDIAVRAELGEQLSPVYLDRSQAEAAFLNIAVNSRDAMPHGGTLFVETAEVVREAGDKSDRLELAPGRYVRLTVTDTGSGMTPEVLTHVFEPFFTTKDVGKGTGLGLSMIYGFVKQSGGDVKIYSEPGIGTAVKLYLPTVDKRQEHDDAALSDPADLPRGSETVLLVEDEPAVREYAKGQLEDFGYHVIAAPDGVAALERIKDLDGCVDLLFTDIIMPGGMDGQQLADRVTALYPNLKVLYTSGYNQNVVIHAGKLPPDFVLLEKPYHRIDLAWKLRQVLDGDG